MHVNYIRWDETFLLPWQEEARAPQLLCHSHGYSAADISLDSLRQGEYGFRYR